MLLIKYNTQADFWLIFHLFVWCETKGRIKFVSTKSVWSVTAVHTSIKKQSLNVIA